MSTSCDDSSVVVSRVIRGAESISRDLRYVRNIEFFGEVGDPREIDSAPRMTPDTTTECTSERSVPRSPPQPSGSSRKSKTIENASRYRTGLFGVQTSKSADFGSGWGNAATRHELRYEPFRPNPGSQNISLSRKVHLGSSSNTTHTYIFGFDLAKSRSMPWSSE